MKAVTRWLIGLAVLAVVAGAFVPAGVPARTISSARAVAPEEALSLSEEVLLKRWRGLAPDEQQRLRARFERFKGIAADRRETLTRRAQRIDQMARHLFRQLSPGERARMEALSPAKRRELMREMAADKAREVGQRIRDKLPPEQRRRLENARPEDRARFIEELRAEQRERMSEVLARLGEELDIDSNIVRRIARLPDEQRTRKMLEFLQKRASMEVGRRGLPEGLTQERWKDIEGLEPDEFFEAIMDLRETHPDFAVPREGRRVRSELQRQLFLAMRPERGAWIELSELGPHERRERIQASRREQVLDVLRRVARLSEDELAALARLSNYEFFSEVRRRFRASSEY